MFTLVCRHDVANHVAVHKVSMFQRGGVALKIVRVFDEQDVVTSDEIMIDELTR